MRGLSFDFRDALAAVASGPGHAMMASERPSVILGAGVMLAAHALLLLLGFSLVGDTYNRVDAELQQNSFLDARATAGVFLVLAGCCAGPLSVGGWLLCVAQRAGRGRLSRRGGAALAALALAGCAGVCAYAWGSLIVPGETYHRGTVTNNQPDTLKQFLGGLLFAAYAPAVLLAACVAVALLTRTPGAPRAAAPLQPEALTANWRGFAGLVLVSALVAFGTATCTPVWNFSSTSYFSSQALDNLDSGKSWSLLDPALKLVLGPPPADPTAWMQPVVYIKLYEDVVVFFGVLLGVAAVGALGTYHPPTRRALHRRVDVGLSKVLRWCDPFPLGASVGELLLGAALAALYAYWVWFWSTRYTRITSEAAALGDAYPRLHVAARVCGHLTTLTMAFLCFPVARNSVWEAAFGVPFDRAVKFHRIMGALCWLLATLHMLLWQLKWLREGNLWNNVTTLRHLIITPCENANLLCFLGPDGRAYASADGIAPPAAQVPCPCVYFNSLAAPDPIINPADHADNFTVPIVEAAWLLLTIALSVALFARRSHYEAFLATHHAVLLFFAAGLVHAWSHWYYTAAGLLLFAFDKVMRAVNAARLVRTLALEVARPGVTRLRVASSFLRGRALYSGQYAWLCVPAVSAVEWHPFTVASPPAAAAGYDGELVFYVKAMGAGTWTARLAELARALRAAQEDADARGGRSDDPVALPCVSVDGPYGRVSAFEGRDTLVLFAGGIGVTPVHALATELAARREKGGAAGALPRGLARVVVVWVVRQVELLEAFAEGFAPLLADASGFFSVHLHVSNSAAPLRGVQGEEGKALLACAGSGGGDGGDDDDVSAVSAGWARQSTCDIMAAAAKLSRPDPSAILGAAVRDARARLGRDPPRDAVLAFVCGPPALVEGVSRAAFAHKTDFHAEAFSF